ncbi:MAG TPA: MFS transporter [Coxiellaceae bacterium]|nr:MFS transporter [Coxiellaceae bacterium]
MQDHAVSRLRRYSVGAKRHATRLYPWVIWLLAAGFYFYKNLLEVSPGVMHAVWMRDFHIDGTQLGNLAAAYFWAYLLMQIPMGIFTDRFGPRRVSSIAIALCALGTLLLAMAPTLSIASLGRFVTGLGASVAAIGCLKLTTLWFSPRRFPTLAGLMMTLGMIGALGGEAPLSASVDWIGWRHSLEIIALVGLVFAFCFWLTVRDHGPHAESTTLPKGLKDEHSIFSGLWQVLTNKQTWWLSLYSGFAYAPIMVFGGLWGVPYLETAYGLSRTVAAEQLEVIFIGFAIGAPIAGWLADRFGRRKPIMFWGTLSALMSGVFVLYCPGLTQWEVTVLLFIFGGAISCFLLCFTMIRQVNRLVLAATAIGFMNSFDAAFGAITDPMIGHFLDLGWGGQMVDGVRVFSLHDYHWGMAAIPLYLALALVCMAFIKETHNSQKN